MRGYLWENLEQEIVAEFAQAHPLALPTGVGSDWKLPPGWGVVSGDLPSVRQGAGLCRVCGSERDKGSRVYCGYHLLMSRQSERARYAPKPKAPPASPAVQDRCPQHGQALMLDLTSKKQMLKVYFCPTRGCKHEVTR